MVPVCAERITNSHEQLHNDTFAASEELSEFVEDVTGVKDVQAIEEDPEKDWK